LKEEALDRTLWRTRFGKGFGPVVRQTRHSPEHNNYHRHRLEFLRTWNIIWNSLCFQKFKRKVPCWNFFVFF